MSDTPRKTPCASCPYRRDVPSGIWSAKDYDKLPAYDGDATSQALSPGGMQLFGCHQSDGHLCSGWVAHRDPRDLLALKVGFAMGKVDASVFTYTTDVPLFASGAEAGAHGKAGIQNPDIEARLTVGKITKVRRARGKPVAKS